MRAEPSGDRGPWILALHSSSETLGVGLQRLGASGAASLAAFPLGRALSNRLIECVETVLPARHWSRLGRLAVATGPGGFTGTRLTVAFARTLAQQLDLPLDGVSSFRLVARRLLTGGEAAGAAPFWLAQDLPRRGTVAGLYAPDPEALAGVAELSEPRLLPSPPTEPCFPSDGRLPEDVAQLLAFSQAAEADGMAAPWQSVVPLYPTGPVQGEVR